MKRPASGVIKAPRNSHVKYPRQVSKLWSVAVVYLSFFTDQIIFAEAVG